MKALFKITSDLEIIPNDDKTTKYIMNRKEGDLLTGDITIYKPDKKRTTLQNGCLHEYIADLSESLNSAGYDVKETITIKVDFTPETVKKYMIHPVMKALYPDKKSTTELSTTEIQCVYENLNRMTADKFGIGILWPSRLNK